MKDVEEIIAVSILIAMTLLLVKWCQHPEYGLRGAIKGTCSGEMEQ